MKTVEQSAALHDLNQKLVRAYRQMSANRTMAQWLQRNLLPKSLPELPGVRMAVQHRKCGQAGGDCYDVFRLDDHHLGFYVADTMGHDLAASLLTVFLKQSIQPTDGHGANSRLVPPNEVLRRLNVEMVGQVSAETPFISMIYGLLDSRDGTITFARAGHPHPLHVPETGELAAWSSVGSLLGIFTTDFPLQQRRLAPGEKLLIHSDGLESTADGAPPAIERIIATAALHRSLPITDYVNQIATDLLERDVPNDDFTLLGIEMTTN